MTIRTNTPHSFSQLREVKLIFSQQEVDHRSSIAKSFGNEFDDCEDNISEKSSSDSEGGGKADMVAALERIENLPCLPVLLEEIFFYSYPEVLSCSNPACCNSFAKYNEPHQLQ